MEARRYKTYTRLDRKDLILSGTSLRVSLNLNLQAKTVGAGELCVTVASNADEETGRGRRGRVKEPTQLR